MRTRDCDWLNIKTHKPAYGFQVFVRGTWRNYAEDGKPCIYESEGERDAKRAEVAKIAEADFTGYLAKPRQEPPHE